MNTLQTSGEFETSIAPIDAADVKIDIRGLDFFYGKTHALKAVSMGVARNRVTALIGPSGCGKSTLLRTLNRMYALYPGQRAEGEIVLDGENVLGPRVDVARLRARVGMVFQKPTPFPMSIYDNVAYGVRLYETLSRPDMDARVEESLTRAALWDEVKDKLKGVRDHTGFMYLGELVEFGPTDQVFTRPATRRTSDYITGRFG